MASATFSKLLLKWVWSPWWRITCQSSAEAGSVPESGSVADPRSCTGSPSRYLVVDVGAAIVGTGALPPAVMLIVFVTLPPRPSETVSLAV